VLTMQQPLSAKVGTTSLTSGGCLVGIVRSWTKATECFGFVFIHLYTLCWRKAPSVVSLSCSYVPGIPSAHKTHITACYSSLVQMRKKGIHASTCMENK
jgi:hypothetical protein